MRKPLQVTLVTSLHLGGHDIVARHLHKERGWEVLWPDQDLDFIDGQRQYRDGCLNPELVRMHEDLLWDLGKNWVEKRHISYYSDPFPGPVEYLAQFDPASRVLLSDPRAMLLMRLWEARIDHLVYVDRDPMAVSLQLEQSYAMDRWPRYNRYDWFEACQTYLKAFEPWRDRAIEISERDLATGAYAEQLDAALGVSQDAPLTFMEPGEREVADGKVEPGDHRLVSEGSSQLPTSP